MLQFIVTAAAVPLCVYLLPGVYAVSWEYALKAGLVLAVAYAVLRPLLRLITKPLGCLTFGLIGTIVDTLLILGCSRLMPGLMLDSFLYALLTALIVNLLRSLVGRRVEDDDD